MSTTDITNPDLEALHGLLLATHQKLSDQLGDTTSIDAANAIVTEMREVLHRIDLVQSLLFTQQTKGIANSVAKVQDANKDLQAALSQVKTVTDVVKGIGKFLGFVDKAIDIAKTAALL